MAGGQLGEPMEAYLRQLEVERRASRHTLVAYRRDLAELSRLAAPAEPAGLAPHDIRRLVAQLHGAGLGGRSIGRRLSAWRGFFRWLVRHRGLASNPAESIRPPRSPSRLPAALTPDQAAALLDAEPDDALEIRDRAMFELFYSSGLRLSELAALDIDVGVDPAAREVTVTGKRGKTRCVPVGDKAMAALAAWRAHRDALAATGEPALFVGQRGHRLSVRSIEARLARWARRCGVGIGVHPHMLRHSFASHLLQSSGDLRAVQELLGHASIRSTQVYTHLDFQHLARVYDAAHPRARKRD